MYHVAIVEDEAECVEKLKECIERYSLEYGVQFNTTTFSNGSEFLFKYSKVFDIVFLDVQMPVINGFIVAKELRKLDEDVVLIFVTYLAQYAYKGYDVDALDYILKPATYAALKLKIDKAITRCSARKAQDVLLNTTEGNIRISMRQIRYVEIRKHNIIYHTAQGDFFAYGTLKQIEQLLPDCFCRCNSCYLVNLRCVTKIQSDEVFLGDVRLQMSRPKKKDFVNALQNYILDGRN